MESNVHVLPVKRKGGRRRTQPVRGIRAATVIALQDYQRESAEARLARYEAQIDAIAGMLLGIARIIKSMDNTRRQ
jgi:hypothetical protein